VIYVACIDKAAAAYSVPQAAIEQLISGHHTSGIGPMGIPADWLPILTRIGFDQERVTQVACDNIAAGAWIIAYETLHSPSASQRQEAPLPTISSPGPDPAPHSAGVVVVTENCITTAAETYHLSLTLFKGVLRTEGGGVGVVHWNGNGTYDIGPAQINSTWLPRLLEAGINRDMVLNDGCLNVTIGAWILAQAMKGADPAQAADFWRHVGDYNSSTPHWNQRYAALVWKNITTK